MAVVELRALDKITTDTMPFYEQNNGLRANAVTSKKKVALITGVTGQVGSVTFRSNCRLDPVFAVSFSFSRSKSVTIMYIICMMRANKSVLCKIGKGGNFRYSPSLSQAGNEPASYPRYREVAKETTPRSIEATIKFHGCNKLL